MNCPPESVYRFASKIDAVGIGNLRKYCAENHPGFQFDHSLAIIRLAIKGGYEYAAMRTGFTRQYARVTMKRMYDYACEMEGDPNA